MRYFFVSILLSYFIPICFSWNLRQIHKNNRILENKHKTYVIDIDGTICKTTGSNYENSLPYDCRIKLYNDLYEQGHEIHYLTARGSVSGKKWDEFTYKQLKSWGVKYDSLSIGKLHYDVWIDDKCINPNPFFCENEK